jgi:flagellin
MTSLLTNNGAMVALQTLKSINKDMSDVQSQISTGKKINNAKDNAAVFAISKVMQSDVAGFKAIQDSLDLGKSSVAVARSATDKVGELLEKIKTKVVSAQDTTVDKDKVQNEINALRDQITNIVGAAQFNGQNLLSETGSTEILSSLNRGSDGFVTSSKITVDNQDLSQTQSTYGAGGTLVAGNTAVSAATIAAAATETVTLTAGAIAEGNSFRITLGGNNYDYVAKDGDTLNDVGARLKDQIDAAGLTDITVSVTSVTDPTATNTVISITNDTAAAVTLASDDQSGGTAGGKLEELGSLDVTTVAGAKSALVHIENLIQQATDASASFGAVESRLEIQDSFVSSLVDNLKSGIGSLVDADMEEASARLQALQVQQQLGTQSLSIANQAPQSVLSLFR